MIRILIPLDRFKADGVEVVDGDWAQERSRQSKAWFGLGRLKQIAFKAGMREGPRGTSITVNLYTELS